MSRRKQPNPKPIKVGEEDLLSDDDDDDELVIFEDSSGGEGDTQDELDSGYMGFHTAQGSEDEKQDREELLEGSSTYRRLRPKRKCTRTIPSDRDEETGWKKCKTEETETHQLFPCPTCSKGFKAQSEIQIHMRKHTGEKPFCCPFCNKAYPRRKTMYRHIREQHPEQWQRGCFPERRYRTAINKAMKDSLRQWKLQRNTSSLGAAPGTKGSTVTGSEDQSRVTQLTFTQHPTTPPTTPGKKSHFDTVCGKYKKIAPAPLKPQLAVVRQMPVSTPSGVQQQFFLVDPQSGMAVPINLATNTSADPAATNAAVASAVVGPATSVAMPTNPQVVVQTASPSVAMPTNPQVVVQTASPPVAMPTNPQSVVQSSSPSVAMPTNPKIVVQTASPSVTMATVGSGSFTQATPMLTTPTTSVVQHPVMAAIPPPVAAHNQQPMVAMATASSASLPTQQAMSHFVMTTLPSSLPLHNQTSQVATTTAAIATIPTPPAPVLQQVVMPTFVPLQYQTPQASMVTVSNTFPSQAAPVVQQTIMPQVFQPQSQGPAVPAVVMPSATVAMAASPSSQIAMTTTSPAIPAAPPAVMPGLLPVQNRPTQVAMTTACQASLPNPMLSQVAMTTASSQKPVQILPAQVATTTTVITPVPSASVVQQLVMPRLSPMQKQEPQVTMTTITPSVPVQSIQPQVSMTTTPNIPPVVMTTLRSLLPVGNQPQGVPMATTMTTSPPGNTVMQVAMTTASSSFQVPSQFTMATVVKTTESVQPTVTPSSLPVPRIAVITISKSSQSFPAIPSSTAVTNTMPVPQIQNVATLTSSSSQTTSQNTVKQSDAKPGCSTMPFLPLQTNAQSTVPAHLSRRADSQTIPVQHSMATVARQQVSSATATSQTKEGNIVLAGQISQISPSPHQTNVRGGTQNDVCLPNLDVDSDEYFIAGGKAMSLMHNTQGKMLTRQHPNNLKTDTSKEKMTTTTTTTTTSILSESLITPVCTQQISKFRPILPRTLESALNKDSGQYKSLTVDVLEKNNTCSLCGSMLRSLRYLIMHLFKFHQHYKCRLCAPRVTETFASEQLLKNHLLHRHWPTHNVPNKELEETARRLHYHFKRACQAVKAVHEIGNPVDVSEITSSEITFKNGETLKYRVNYNILTPGKFMNDGDITVKRTNTNALSITCIFFHTSSVLKGGKAELASKGMIHSSADGTASKEQTERMEAENIPAAPPNVAVLPKGRSFEAIASTQKEGRLGLKSSLQTASASLSSPQSTSSASHPDMSEGVNQSETEDSTGPTDALEWHCCDVCGQVFADSPQLQKHMNIHIMLKPFKCNLCCRAFPHAATLEAHVKAHYKGEIENEPTTIPANVRISFCKESKKGESPSERGNNEETVEADSATADSEEDSPSDDGANHMCKLCGKTYTNSASLVRHLWTHQKGFKLSCPICGKGFNLSYHLKEHMNVHTKTKPYKCHICGKSFTHSGTLSAHLKSHKSREGIVAEYSSFRCRYCSKQFTHIKKYLEHLKARHGVFDFDFEEAEKDIIMSKKESASQSGLETENTAKETDKSGDVPATSTVAATNASIAASVQQENLQSASSIHTSPSEQTESEESTSGQGIRHQTRKTVAELIGLRKAKSTTTESFSNVSQSSGEAPPLVITQAISLRPFVDKIIAASTPEAHAEPPNVTKFKPILPKAYMQTSTGMEFQVSPGSTLTMEGVVTRSMKKGPSSLNTQNVTESRWKIKDFQPMADAESQRLLELDVARQEMPVNKHFQMTRFKFGQHMTMMMEAAATPSFVEGQNSPNSKIVKESRWKIQHFQPMADAEKQRRLELDVARQEMPVHRQFEMRRFKYGQHVHRWFKCRKCGVAYNSKLHLKHHMCGACSKYMMKCGDCDLTFSSFKRLEHHLTMEHSEEYSDFEEEEETEEESGESEGEGDGVRMDTTVEQREQERQEWRSNSTNMQEEANCENGQVAIKVEPLEESSMEATNHSIAIKQEELESQKWWFEGDGDLEGNKMADCEVKEEVEDASYEDLRVDDLHMENFVQFNERMEKTVDKCGQQQFDDQRSKIKTEVQGQGGLVSDQVETTGQHGSQSERSREAETHYPDQSEHRDNIQERRQMDQSCAKEKAPSVHESRFVGQSEDMVLDMQLSENSQSGRTLEVVSQPEAIGHHDQKLHVEESETKGPQAQMYRCMLCGPKQEKLLSSADLALHLTGYHHVENPDVFMQGPLCCFSTGKN